jgi:hypothetical protein
MRYSHLQLCTDACTALAAMLDRVRNLTLCTAMNHLHNLTGHQDQPGHTEAPRERPLHTRPRTCCWC